jgi:hypothetical protein
MYDVHDVHDIYTYDTTTITTEDRSLHIVHCTHHAMAMEVRARLVTLAVSIRTVIGASFGK